MSEPQPESIDDLSGIFRDIAPTGVCSVCLVRLQRDDVPEHAACAKAWAEAAS